MTDTPSNEKKETELKEIIEGLQSQDGKDSLEGAILPEEDAREVPDSKAPGMEDMLAQTETSEGNEVPADEKKSKEPKSKSAKQKKSLLAGIMLNQYVLSVMVILLIVGAIGFFLFLQKDWIKVKGNKMVSTLVEKKLEESLDKYMESNKKLQDGVNGSKTKKKLSGSAKGENVSSDAMQESEDVEEDRTEYVIEANRLYEQGDYKTAASLYEKGLDKSMPFLNEDFIVYRLGDCYFNSGNYKAALEVFRHLNNDYLNSEYQLRSRLKMGECYAELGEYQQARKTLYTVIAHEGNCATEEDKSCVVDSYFKIGDYYLEEAKRLKNASRTIGTMTAVSGEKKAPLETKKEVK
ncbi:MAG: tetratricopeptide repeat protein [Planctomycetes bacterium]|nr:tetratricopeptide repeat protein [Planctomycetota bacterium]